MSSNDGAGAAARLLQVMVAGFVFTMWSRNVATTVLATNTSTHLPLASFVFGDSIVDAGNNNYLRRSLATATNLPNGIDFPYPNANHPTGRFTNGLTIVDIVGQDLGVADFAPPVLAPTTTGTAILNGVNYASGGAGILNDTGRLFVDYISMDQQIDYFEGTVRELKAILGVENTQTYLAQAILSITLGANDFLGNYLVPVPVTREAKLPQDQFIQRLITLLRGQLIRLYNAGARKMVVVNVPIIGCTPYLRSTNVGTNGQCMPRANNVATAYNAALRVLLQQLNQELPAATLLYADAYGVSAFIIQNYRAYGFGNAESACCGLVGSERGIIPCRYRFVPLCNNRGEYFFWDPYHPSENANRIIASEFLRGSRFISPINIRQLVAL